MGNRIDRNELINLIKNAKKCVRVLGAVAFDLPYNELKDSFFEKINGDNDFELEIICESDSALSYDSLISSDRKVSGEDARYEYGVLKSIVDEPLRNLKDYLKKRGCKHLEPAKDIKDTSLTETEKKQKFFIKTYYLSAKIPVIKIDDDYYISYALTKFNRLEYFEKITQDHPWYEEFKKYFYAFLECENGAQKYATEYTDKENKLEVIEMYNEKRIPLGQLPRDSFMDTTRVKVVVWGLIFTRDGKLLIHKRAENAKDNRDMWDKSVGGHVDIEKDIDTVKAAAREMIEELYSHEEEGQGGHNRTSMFKVDSSYLIFLGEWRPEFRYDKLYEEIDFNKNQNYYFRMSYDYSSIVRESPRYLPNGKVRRVRVFADLYVCVTDDKFEERVNSEKLSNSEYLLLYPDQIKDLYFDKECRLTDREVEIYNKKIENHKKMKQKNLPYHLENNILVYDGEFKISPDMQNIINSELWENEVSAFSSELKKRNK
ncbi:MAG: NUDIX domain-containing protein [Erysipelotrichales bacterium]|nr:NUDIX domain-containing protein [Erysipelotrichales bacterium]